MSSDDESIEPFIDNLWYFDSVVSPGHCNGISSPPNTPSKKTAPPLLSRESSLPLSTGGLSFPDLPFPETSLTEESEYCPSNLNPSSTTQNEDSQTQDVFTAMDDNHGSELSRDELYPWMRALSLQYTKDGMIQVKPNHDEGSESESRAVSMFLLNKLIDKESDGAFNEQVVYSKPQLVAHHDVFRPFDKVHNGLISPGELRKGLANLGLLKDGKDTDITNVINHVDRDGDGPVSGTEFERMDENPSMDQGSQSN